MQRAMTVLVAGVLILSAAPTAFAVAPSDGGAITVWPFPVSPATGANVDPHIDGWFASYTSGSRIHFFDVFYHADRVVTGPDGTQDQPGDISHERIAFSRTSPTGTAIMLYDGATDTTTEVDPQPAPLRVGSAIGGDTVAFIDLHASPEGELFASRLGGATTRITNDARTDQKPAVAPSGDLIVYESCTTSCDIRQAAWNGASWVVNSIASTTDPESDPDTDGSVVVYDAVRSGDRDIFWQPVGGGAEQRLGLPGEQRNPAVRGGFVTFESLAPGAPSWDIYAYDIATNRVFQVAVTPANESMTDVDVLSDGRLRVLWVTGDGSQRDVLAADFGIPPAGSHVVTPHDGGAFTFLPVAIDTGTGDQFDAHVDGDFASYTAPVTGSSNGIRLYDFLTGDNVQVAQTANTDDELSDVDGNRIAFTRLNDSTGYSSIDLYDIGTASTTEIDPQPNALRFDPAIGGNTIAWTDEASFPPAIYVSRSGGAPVRLPNDNHFDESPSVAPNGDVVVYKSCVSTLECEVRQAAWDGAGWVVSTLASGTFIENVATDGSVVVYGATRSFQADIYWQPVGGGPEQRLSMPGEDLFPAVSGGVISFSTITEFNGAADLYLYEIATDRLFRVTSTQVNEFLSDIDVLPDGRIRLVWNSGESGDRDVYGATIELPPVGQPSHFGGFSSPVDALPILNQMKAGAAVPIRFSLGGDFGLSIFATGYPKSQIVACDSTAPVDGVEITVSAGGSSLSYDPVTGLYSYVWKTDKAWRGCRQLVLGFADGSFARANFLFK